MKIKSLNVLTTAMAMLLSLLATTSARADSWNIVSLPTNNTDIATGITTNKTYLCAYCYGNYGSFPSSINSVQFYHAILSGGNNTFSTTNWVYTNSSIGAAQNYVGNYGRVVLNTQYTNANQTVIWPTTVKLAQTSNTGVAGAPAPAETAQADGNMQKLLAGVCYTGGAAPVGVYMLQEYDGLTPGHPYSLVQYYRQWSTNRIQQVYFSNNGGTNWEQYPNNPFNFDGSPGAHYLEWDFTAQATNVFCLMTNLVANSAAFNYGSTLQDDSYPFAPFITRQPVPTVVGNLSALTNIAMSAQVVGSPTVSYQWYSNNVNSYVGATPTVDGGGLTGSLTTNLDTTVNLVAYYYLVASSTYGSATSSIVAFNPNPQFVTQASAINVGNAYVNYSVAVEGIPPFTYGWYFNTANSYSGATATVDSQGYPGSYTGSATTSLNATTNLQDFYFVMVTNSYSHVTSSITSYNPKPIISMQPGAFRSGNSVGMTVAATGWPTLSYQWYVVVPTVSTNAMTDGGGISGSHTANVTINNLQDGYFVVVTNYYGSVTSAVEIVDSTPLTVIGAGEPIWNQGSQTNVCVYFSDFVDPVTATIPGNYLLSGGSVSSAAVVGSNEVVLTTSPLSGSQTLTVQNVEDYYTLTMAPSSTNLTVGLYPANLALWVRANAANTTPDGSGGIDQWNDLSGNNNTLIGFEGSPIDDPILATNAWGDPVVRFTSSPATGLGASSVPSLKIVGNMSIVAVVNFATTGATNCEIVSKTGDTPTVDLNIPAPYDYYLNGTTAALFRGNGAALGDGNSYGQYSAPNGPSIGVPHVLVVSEYGNAINEYVDGNLVGAGILNGGFPVANIADGGNGLYVGWRTDGAQALDGDIAELIMAGSALSTYDVTQLTSYLSQVHNLALPGASPANIAASFSAATANLTLSWPTNYTGWILQEQTDTVSTGLGTNWVNVGSSTSTNVVVMPVNTANGCVFYRLIYAP